MFGKKYILFFILLVGFFLRVVNLDTNPVSMHADEADTGYTALSLLRNGMDPYGNFLPLQFKAQSEVYKSPIYTYSTVPFVFLLGLSPFSTRIASVFYGVVFIYIIYLLTRKLFEKESISLIAAGLTAINPWSIHLSRTGVEVNSCVVLLTAAVTAFLYIGKSKYMVLLSSFLFGLSVYTYHVAKIAAPLIIVLLIFLYWKKLASYKKVFFISALVFTIMYGYMLTLAAFSKGASEFNNVSIFNNDIAAKMVNEQRERTNAPLAISSIYNNKPIYYLREMTNTFFGPLSVNFLFLNGENSLDKGYRNYGQFHLFELIFVVSGLYISFKSRKKVFVLLTSVLVIGLLPATATSTSYFAYRDIVILPVITIFSAVGFYHLYKHLKKKKWAIISYGFISFLFFSFFLYNVYFAYPYYSRDWWAYSQKEALEYASKSDKEQIFIHGGLDWAILFAFYHNVDPVEFQKAYANAIEVEGQKIMQIDNLYFGNLLRDEKKLSYRVTPIGETMVIAPYKRLEDKKLEKVFRAVDGGSVVGVYYDEK